MPEIGSLLLVHLVEKQAEGYRFVRSRGEWPLHITLAPWFLANDEATVLERLAAIASSEKAFEVVVGSRQLFGTHQEVPVNIIFDQTKIKQLHEKLAAALRRLNVTFYEERWMDENYRAHITRHEHDGRWRNEGDREAIDDFHLVRLLDDNICEVVKRFELGGEER